MVPETLAINPTNRFSNRVDNYIKYRPSYPKEVVSFLEDELGLKKEDRVADIGSGTGLFAELLLEKGYKVVCIEPNAEMRKAAEAKLGKYEGFSSRDHQAEQTGLRTHSVNLITVATAFHWMEPVATKKEFNRILKPDGHIVLAWNIRKTDSPFLKSYHELKQLYSLEPPRNNVDEEAIRVFFEPEKLNVQSFSNVQKLDFDGLKGQLLSSSYIPLPGHQSYDTMISSLVQLFVAYSENGFVKMEYETKLYWNLK
jgi:ubiquinone/menaquinone biosynthesis C-methylase UbiE